MIENVLNLLQCHAAVFGTPSLLCFPFKFICWAVAMLEVTFECQTVGIGKVVGDALFGLIVQVVALCKCTFLDCDGWWKSDAFEVVAPLKRVLLNCGDRVGDVDMFEAGRMVI